MICSVQLFALLPAVDVGRVEEIDADLQGLVHDRMAVGLAGGPGPKFMVPEAEAADFEAGSAEVGVLHGGIGLWAGGWVSVGKGEAEVRVLEWPGMLIRN